jgi:hypothetical protein
MFDEMEPESAMIRIEAGVPSVWLFNSSARFAKFAVCEC